MRFSTMSQIINQTIYAVIKMEEYYIFKNIVDETK